jgi:hypothetical protein
VQQLLVNHHPTHRPLALSRERTSVRAGDDAGDLRVIVPEEAPVMTPRTATILLEILVDATERRRGRDDSSSA